MKSIDNMFTASHVLQSLKVRGEVSTVRYSESNGGYTFEADVPADEETAEFEEYLKSFESGYGASITKTKNPDFYM